MIALVIKMAVCLAVAAGIGALVGWWLRQVSVRSLKQHNFDLMTVLQTKQQALHQTQLELKAKTDTIQIYENKIAAAEAAVRSAQDELAVRTQRLKDTQQALEQMSQRFAALESEHRESLDRWANSDTMIATHQEETRQAQADYAAAQKSLAEKENEVRLLQQQLAELGKTLKETDRLKSLVAELEPAQGRVHWLEVQLSEKEAEHRAALHESITQRIALTDRISELEPQQATLEELRATLAERDSLVTSQVTQLAVLRQQLEEARALQAAVGKDDLKKIPGIDKVTERALNKLGTFTYVQIAKWTSSDLEKIAHQLQTLPSRIRRENWIAGAKEQHRGKYGERI